MICTMTATLGTLMKNNCMYVIIDAKDGEDVNFAEVMQTSADSMRYCVD